MIQNLHASGMEILTMKRSTASENDPDSKLIFLSSLFYGSQCMAQYVEEKRIDIFFIYYCNFYSWSLVVIKKYQQRIGF